jgi:hypothetical integral membrane protein (TIGR02206 family)
MAAIEFRLFGPIHLAILAAVAATAGFLALQVRRKPHTARPIRLGLAALLTVNIATWYTHQTVTGGFRFPTEMPLQLCDIATWLGIAAAFTLNPLAYDLAYYAALAGSGMALLTPDVWAPLCTYPIIRFFIEHGLLVATILFLAWSGQARPRPGSVWRAILAVQVYAVAIGIYNAAFGTNYFYLRNKPERFSILSWFGPWPWYILGGEALALLLFALLWLPFRPRGSAAPRYARSPVP